METEKENMMSSMVRFVSSSDLLEMPKPYAVIDGFIQEQEAVVLYGKPNGGKSFLALDWALSIASGRPWLGLHEVAQGPVVYMAGEGAASLQKRVKAWMTYHGVTQLPGMYFQTRPLPLRDPEMIEEIQHVLHTFSEQEYGGGPDAALYPRLIVVDTLSQFLMGGDENGPDMALFVSNVRHLSQEHNTAVLVVHHTNKSGFEERGHSALRGNVDVMFKCSPIYQGPVLAGLDILNDKQRDQERAATVSLKLLAVEESLVIVPTMAPPDTLPDISVSDMSVLKSMLTLEDEKTEKVLNKDIVESTGMWKGTVHKRLERLAYLKLVKHREGKSALTTLGRAVLDKAGIKREEE
jgi:hypothetical protein